jgi:hypothetical protein
LQGLKDGALGPRDLPSPALLIVVQEAREGIDFRSVAPKLSFHDEVFFLCLSLTTLEMTLCAAIVHRLARIQGAQLDARLD